jgi:hypothetical protein
MRYRLLSGEELEIFDEDFKYFLISNGVTNEEWLEMNESDHEKATKLVALFSDSVLEKVYQKIQFLEFRSVDSCLVFNFLPDFIELISINKKPGSDLSLETPESIHEALLKNAVGLTYFKTKKKYNTLREMEIHQMTMQGCVNSTSDFWEALEKLIAKES